MTRRASCARPDEVPVPRVRVGGVGHNRAMRDDERLEQLMALIGSQLPEPVDQHTAEDGSMIFVGGAPPEVVVHLRDSSVRVSAYAGVWESADRFAVRPWAVGMLKWRRLPETALMHALTTLIKGAREARLAQYRPCRLCERTYPPEALMAGDVCASCAEAGPVVH